MTRTLLSRLLLATAAASTIAASSGVAVPAHEDQPGTPLYHDHVLGAYRFGFLLPLWESSDETSPLMAQLHRTLLAAGVPLEALQRMPGMPGTQLAPQGLGVVPRAAAGPVQDLAVELALLVLLVPRLPRPTRRLVAELPPARLVATLWQLAPAHSPPRALALP